VRRVTALSTQSKVACTCRFGRDDMWGGGGIKFPTAHGPSSCSSIQTNPSNRILRISCVISGQPTSPVVCHMLLLSAARTNLCLLPNILISSHTGSWFKQKHICTCLVSVNRIIEKKKSCRFVLKNCYPLEDTRTQLWTTEAKLYDQQPVS
jgi:hypothetical protein